MWGVDVFGAGFKLKQAGQSAGDNIADVAGKVGTVVKSRWAIFQDARQRPPPPGDTVQERFISAAANTGVILRKGISETKEKVAVGKVKVEEVRAFGQNFASVFSFFSCSFNCSITNMELILHNLLLCRPRLILP